MQNSEEAFAITLFGLCGGLVKLCSTADNGFLSSDIFVSLVDKINNLDVGESSDRWNSEYGDRWNTEKPKNRHPREGFTILSRQGEANKNFNSNFKRLP